MTIINYSAGPDGLNVEWQSGETSEFSYFWLRDNARDPVSFDSQSHQRELFTAMVPADIRPEHLQLSADGDSFHIKWPDLDTIAEYASGFLSMYRQPATVTVVPAPTLWDANSLTDDTIRIEFAEATRDDGNAVLLKILAAYGFALITDCPCEQQSVAKIANNIGYIRETIFGGLWEFEANASMADSAYTPKELRPHTDSTYSLDAPGLQLLLCLSYDAIGGESVMVDGFAVADQLRQDDAALYDAISRIDVTGIYKGDGTILEASRPILRHDNDGQLVQVTFNNYDRKTVRLAEPDMRHLYSGIRYLDRLYNDPAYQWRHQLKPGQMLIFDNWRILHGRGAFQGKRKMAGAYLNREDYLGALRMQKI